MLGSSNLFLHDNFALSLSHRMLVPVILGTAVEISTEGNWTSTAYILLEYVLHVLVALPWKGWCKLVCCLQLEEEGSEIQKFYQGLEISGEGVLYNIQNKNFPCSN